MISFVRGDSFNFKVLLQQSDGSPLEEKDIDTAIVTCRKYPNEDSKIIFEKNADKMTFDSDGYCHVEFLPEDTENLDYGTYYFDLEITLKNGYRKTRLWEFELTKETTIHTHLTGVDVDIWT